MSCNLEPQFKLLRTTHSALQMTTGSGSSVVSHSIWHTLISRFNVSGISCRSPLVHVWLIIPTRGGDFRAWSSFGGWGAHSRRFLGWAGLASGLASLWQALGKRVASWWQASRFFGKQLFRCRWREQNICVFHKSGDSDSRPSSLCIILKEHNYGQRFLLTGRMSQTVSKAISRI